MIVFDLACDCGYTFEGWFQDRSEFEKQHAAAFLICPVCGGHKIRKILSPIRFQSASNIAGGLSHESRSADPENIAEVTKALETLQNFVEKNFEDVGTDLAKESLKIHFGVTEPRNIRGITTEAEEKELQKEGIELLKIPMPPHNRDVN